jgi:long-chain acyl-CoA synthetase
MVFPWLFMPFSFDSALAGVSNWERVRKFVVLPRPFTVAGGDLTVSLKLRRGVVLAKHRAAVEALYREGGAEAV